MSNRPIVDPLAPLNEPDASEAFNLEIFGA
jgi:hypothetical protein